MARTALSAVFPRLMSMVSAWAHGPSKSSFRVNSPNPTSPKLAPFPPLPSPFPEFPPPDPFVSPSPQPMQLLAPLVSLGSMVSEPLPPQAAATKPTSAATWADLSRLVTSDLSALLNETDIIDVKVPVARAARSKSESDNRRRIEFGLWRAPTCLSELVPRELVDFGLCGELDVRRVVIVTLLCLHV